MAKKNEKNVIKHIQNTLTPIILEEGMPGYVTVQDVEEKLNDPEVFNIAITGPYGSGKSTVLKSLKARYPNNHKYLIISLASLTGDNFEGKNLDEKEQQKVEYSLLQQLIYKEKPETLPNSRFRRIAFRSVKETIIFGICMVLFFLCFLIVFEPQWIKVETLYNFFDLGDKWNLLFDIVCSIFMLLLFYQLVAYLYRISIFSKIKALNVKNVKIEVNQDSSVFNKHLEEIVYFFESTDYNVVIIEDLDRFGCPEIFQKLREINFLLRQSEVLKEQKRSVKFIYAIKDDLFKDAERTKFFDYIATVIPVVNPKNSCEKLTQELVDRGYKLNKDTLRDLSEYVDDMRMLKNVVNEFQQYMEMLSQSSTPNQEKLLAMIIYKNHHPDDFGQLHYKKGKVYDFIKSKPEWIQTAIEKVIEPRLDLWQKKREEVVNSQRFTLKQWRIIYLEKYRHHLTSSLASISVKGTYHNINEFVENELLFEDLISRQNISYRYNHYSTLQNASADIPFSELEKEVDDKIGYLKRKELASTSISEIDNEIRMVREEENRLKGIKLAKLLVQFPEIKDIESFKKIKLSDLMIHFLQRGYIDETYYDYLTLYDGTTMSLNDRDLLSRIRQNDVNISSDEAIDDIKAFVEDLPLFVYEYRSILNYQVADYLEDHSVTYSSALLSFEQHFTSSTTPPLDFLANYYRRGSNGADKLWKKYVRSNYSWSRIQTFEKREYWDTLVEAWLHYAEPSDIDGGLIDWLNNNLGFCVDRLDAIGMKHLKALISKCSFKDLNPLGPIGGQLQGSGVMEFANYILENGLFELSANNIFVACEITGSPFDGLKGADFVTVSDVLSSGNEGFKEYIKDNFKEVFTNFIYNSKGQETEEGILFIINRDDIEDQQKVDLLKRQQGKVIDIKDIKDPYKPLSIRGKVLYPSWNNVIDYYLSDKETVSKDLESFIDENVDLLLKSSFPEDINSSFPGSIVYGSFLNISAYEKLLAVLIQNVGENDEEKLSKDTGIDRVKLLVNNQYLSDDVKTAQIVEQYGTPLYARYLSNHINRVIANFDDYNIDSQTLSLMLSGDTSLTKRQRWNLARKVTIELVQSDTDLADAVLSLMLKRNEELSWSIVEAVMEKASLQPNKQQFQESLIKRYRESAEKEKSILKRMDSPYNEIVDDSKRPLIPKSFKEYLDILKPLGLFTSYSEKKKGYRVYHSTK